MIYQNRSPPASRAIVLGGSLLLLFAFLVVSSSVGYAQSTTAGSGAAAPSKSLEVDIAKASSPVFRSAFDGYQPYREEKMMAWGEANDTAARIGGWLAYAKEANSTEAERPAVDKNGGAKP